MPAQPRRIGPAAVPLADMVPSWVRALDSENHSPHTISTYTRQVRYLTTALGDQATTDITAAVIQDYLAAEFRRLAPASVATAYRSLQVFFKWLSAEEPSLMPVSPMTAIRPPVVPRKRKAPFEDSEIRALLATCSKDTPENRRDAAIIRVLIDTGMRISGLAGLRLLYRDKTGRERTDVHLDGRPCLVITLKGGDERAVGIGRKTTAALDRHLRARARHKHAALPWLWLGARGQFTGSGIGQMLERRAQLAGVEGVHPHRFRRTFAQVWLHSGGQERDLMNIAGWSSREMIAVYTEELGEDRARAAHARLSPGDRI